MKYQIVNLRPENYVFGASWDEAIESLFHAMQALDLDVEVNTNQFARDATPIVFGAHHLKPGEHAHLPAGTIIYNFEQTLPGYQGHHPPYLDLLGKCHVWDFSRRNAAQLHRTGVAPHARHLSIGYVPPWSRIVPGTQDIDVLFFGNLSARRRQVLGELSSRGMRVFALTSVFGAERDAWIARARLVINLRMEEGGAFESLRVHYLMANRVPVVTEAPPDGDWEADLLPGVCAVGYEALADACTALLDDPDARETLGATAFQLISSPRHQMTSLLQPAMPGTHRAAPGTPIQD